MTVSIEFACPRREYADETTPEDVGKPVEGPKLTGLEYVQATYDTLSTTDGKVIAVLNEDDDWALMLNGHVGESYSDFTIWSE